MSSIFGVYSEIRNAERAVNELKQREVTSNSISIIVKRGVINSYLSRYDNWPHFSSQVTIRRATIIDLMALLLGVGARRLSDIGATIITGFLSVPFDGLDKGFVDVLSDIGVPEPVAKNCRQAVRNHNVVLAISADDQMDDVYNILQETEAEMVHKVEMSTFEDN
ncbi:MAG: hypothetical protein KDE51_19215 [Anaerolineales bacterium]|nr:hypothetical protein [Anaerolineales bacterium]